METSISSNGYTLGAWALARLLTGVPVTTLDLDGLEEPWWGLAQQVAKANGAERKAVFYEIIGGRPDAGDLEYAVFNLVDPTGPPPETRTDDQASTPAVFVPELPAEARLSNQVLAQAEQVGQWLNTYVAYASKRGPQTPTLFHEAGGLWLGSVAIARRLYCPMPHGDIWPNLYLVWVARTTIFHKTTSFNVAEEIARDALGHLLMPNEWTPEALLSELAGKDPTGLDDLPQEARDLWQARRNFAAQRGLIIEEFSGILASARKDYNAGLTETILRLHDCPRIWERRTQTHGLIRIQAAYLSILSVTTPMALSAYLGKPSWLSGFWPRFALLTPEVKRPDYKREDRRPDRPGELIERLSWLACKALSSPIHPTPPQAQPVRLSAEAYEAWKRYDKAVQYDLLDDELDETLWGFYGRLPTQALKVATILAALDWDGQGRPEITLGHWARAQSIAESWRASVHRLLVPAQAQEEQQEEERVLGVIRRAGKATVRDVYLSTGLPRDKVENIINQLTRDGLIEAMQPPTGKRGRKTTYYQVSTGINFVDFVDS